MMHVPKVAFLTAGLTQYQQAVAAMGVPPRVPSNEDIETAWNQRLREIANEAIPGTITIGELVLLPAGTMAMVTYEVEEEA